MSLAQILCGEVNPSGRTVDLWSRDFLSDPTVKNFEDIRYSNAEGIVLASNYNSPEKPAGLYFLEYEEGIYLGYRYYETASDIGAIRYGSTDERGRLGQAGAVNYPFGYGLSYTRFEQTVKEVVKDETSLGVLVQVENTGSRDGSEVVQIYYKAPYTQYDAANGVEKSTKNLIAFEKVYIPAGEKREVLLRFNLEDMASYAYKHPNRDGTCGCYMLEAGEYMQYLGKNSHDSFCSFSVKIPDTIFYEGDNMRLSDKEAQSKRTEDGFATEFPQNAAKGYCSVSNRFEDVTAYMLKNDVTLLSRKSWLTTFPTAPEKKALDAVRLKRAVTYNPYTDARTGNVATNPDYTEDYPAQKAEPTLKFSDMRGIDYYDAAWDDFLDALDLGSEEVRNLLLKAAGHTGEISAVNKPATFDTDGPQGLKRVETNFDYEAYGYAGQIVLGATFNKRLGYAFGEAVGKEALQTGVNGWYAPGLNLHRGPFGGRNYEYFSEDPLLSGKMGAQVISGAADCGLLTYVKHFAMNNYEGPATCLSVWATEQTIRELYLKSFEIAVKESRRTVKYIRNIQGEAGKKIMRGCMGIMGAANLIGTEWCAANYDLLQGVLRGEWGFTGAVTTDMSLQVSHGIVDKIFRCGGDLRMYYREAELLDDNSATMSVCIRRAVKNVCFAYVNGNIMQGVSPGAIITYKISPWKIWLLSIDAVILVAEIVCVILLVRRKRLNARRSSKLT